MKINKYLVMLMLLLIVGCSENEALPVVEIPEIIEHTYYSIGEEVTSYSSSFTVNSFKVENAFSKEGTKWVSLDITFQDESGQEEEYQEYASQYPDLIMVDDEGYAYKGYSKEQTMGFYGSTRDLVLFMVPQSKNDFLLFDDFLFEASSKFDDYSRDAVKINLNP